VPRTASALLFKLPEAFAEAGLLPVHGPKLFEHAAKRVVESLHTRLEMHVIT
jgi:hypothetical protein